MSRLRRSITETRPAGSRFTNALTRSTASVISPIESGRHATSAKTLKRLAEALDARAVIGFEFSSNGRSKHELVALDIVGTSRTLRVRGLEKKTATLRTMIGHQLGNIETTSKSSGTDWEDCLAVSGLVLSVWSLFLGLFLALKNTAPIFYKYATFAVPFVFAGP